MKETSLSVQWGFKAPAMPLTTSNSLTVLYRRNRKGTFPSSGCLSAIYFLYNAELCSFRGAQIIY